jgi:mRNA interferase MazF
MFDKIIKKFEIWFPVKSKLDNNKHRPPYFKEGEIWWSYIGENIGIESNGKSNAFTRPVLVFKKYDQYSFLAIPLTTKPKTGSWYHTVCIKNVKQTATLSQGRVMDYRRLKEKICELERYELYLLYLDYIKLHIKIDPSHCRVKVVGNPQI